MLYEFLYCHLNIYAIKPKHIKKHFSHDHSQDCYLTNWDSKYGTIATLNSDRSGTVKSET